MFAVFAVGTYLELASPEAKLYVVVALAGTAAFVVAGTAVVAAVVLDSCVIDDPSRSVMTQGTSIGHFGWQ